MRTKPVTQIWKEGFAQATTVKEKTELILMIPALPFYSIISNVKGFIFGIKEGIRFIKEGYVDVSYYEDCSTGKERLKKTEELCSNVWKHEEMLKSTEAARQKFWNEYNKEA